MPTANPADPGRFLPGTLVGGRYRIVALVGRGGMGEVYRADDVKLGQTVAIKFLPEAVERDEERRTRLLGEVRIARQISHPNVCRVYDVGDVDGRYFLSMEYVDGEDLASLLRRIGRLPHEKAVQIARELCAGLHAAHEQGVLHRDLKPANIMIDGRGRARITDFGLAGLAAEFSEADASSGTPAYMAPEQLAGKEVTVRSDLYALGLVLYELFTGRAAFLGEGTAVLAFLRQKTPHDTPSDVIAGLDPVVERAVMRCLQPDPANRPSSVLQLAAELPGGDPLAAALAAGETPAPDVVAHGGTEGGLRPAVALACLGAFVIGVLGVAALAPRLRITSMVAPGKPPAVLAERAREIVRSLGYSDSSRDQNFGYWYDSRCLEYVAEHDSTPQRWKRLARTSPPAVTFWYRQSPGALVPSNVLRHGVPSPNDPPPLRSGMLAFWLTPQGVLQTFTLVPSVRDSVGPLPPEPDWQPLFVAAGLDSTRFTRVPSTRTPFNYADRRAAWRGWDPGDSTIALRIEATSFRGKPTGFQIWRPWDRSMREGRQPRSGWESALLWIGIGVLLGILFGACFLARRNVRLGRSDRRTATRLGASYVILMECAWVFEHHVPDVAELVILFSVLALNISLGILIWLLYLALEPYLRRLWATTMVSWIRLMDGRIRDPLVGRDVLVGCVSGVAITAIGVLFAVAPPWMGLPPPRPDLLGGSPMELEALSGPSIAVANALTMTANAVPSTLLPLVTLLLIRLGLRRAIPSYVAWLIVGSVLAAGGQGNPGLQVALAFVQNLLLLVLFLRFGLVAVASMTIAGSLMYAFPLTLDFGAWNATGGIVAMLFLAALATYGFLVSLGGQPLFRDVLPEAEAMTRGPAQRR